AATFDNTLAALEKSGRLLDRASRAFDALTSANTTDNFQKMQEDLAPKLSAHNDEMYLNEKLFKRIDTIYQQREKLNLEPEAKKLAEYYYEKFVMRGANLSDSNKAKLKKLNEEEALLTTKFSNQLLGAAKNAALVVDTKEELDGLSDEELAAAGAAAKDAGKEGKYLLKIINTTQQPLLQNLNNRETRKKLFEASWNRAERSDSNDTRQNILRLAKIRIDKANLLGFPTYAAWKLQDQVAKNPQAVQSLFAKLVPAATAKANAEAQELKAFKAKQNDTTALEPWDWNYYSEKVRKEKYDLDENQIKPYFVVDSVMQNGVFYAATQLYGITFKARTDISVYNPDVKVFEVFYHDSTAMALLYLDYYKRDNKNGGAWMNNFVDQSKLLGTKPVIANVFNYAKTAGGGPALISWDDVTTLFHEFGHSLHGLFANQTYPSLSGTAVARDFVEMPSQFNEHWALDSSVLKNYAKHYKTGEAMPQALIDKIKNAATFNQGYGFTEILAASNLDMQWHSLTAKDSAVTDVDAFEKQALEKTKLFISYVPPRYRSSYFLHIWSNGYSAGYYAYTWSEMLDNDAFAWFKENGGLTRANGQRFRDMILSKGNTEDLSKMYREFRGKEPSITPLLENRGLIEEKPTIVKAKI
ncbi:MAG: dipeptidyl carboxypeptidase II, partial [Sphingobacteriales bacterium 41-5]